MKMSNYIVCWTEGENLDNSTDYYHVFLSENYDLEDTKKMAIAFYKELLQKEGVLIANLTKILRSTDYGI